MLLAAPRIQTVDESGNPFVVVEITKRISAPTLRDPDGTIEGATLYHLEDGSTVNKLPHAQRKAPEWEFKVVATGVLLRRA
jgi:hypothetical protein